MQKIAENVYIETGFYGGNVGAVITDAGLVCIDTPPLPTEARRWRSQLAHLSASPIIQVVNTAHFPTRLIGNRWFNAPVLAHSYTVTLLNDHPELFRAGLVVHEAHENLPELSSVRPVMPEMTMSQDMQVHRGDTVVQLESRPGAARSAVWVRLPEHDVTFVGDTVIGGGHPQLMSANLVAWLDELDALKAETSTFGTVVPGRGEPFTKAKSNLDYIRDYVAWLHEQLADLAAKDAPVDDAMALTSQVLRKFPVTPTIQALTEQRLYAALPALYQSARQGYTTTGLPERKDEEES